MTEARNQDTYKLTSLGESGGIKSLPLTIKPASLSVTIEEAGHRTAPGQSREDKLREIKRLEGWA